ncbi:MAG: hypothetical protein PHG96_13530 [Kiritimatiellae bacterium]|nr:hypothetical protein [Kiritimatiellia bacterium]
MRLIVFLFLAALSVCAEQGAENRVRIDFFYSPGCTECERVKKDVLPQLAARFADSCEIFRHDLTVAETIPLLVAYQDKCGNTENGSVSLVVDQAVFLSGYEAAATGLVDQVSAALLRHSQDVHPPAGTQLAQGSAEAVRKRAGTLTLSVVAAGGLLDGFNPCAISTLIFFMSLLVVTKASRRTRMLVGVSFISASFLVYTGLGLGFLYAFRRAPNFALTKKIVEVVLGLCMIPLAALSFRDAFRFRRSQRPDDVTLQIPKKTKARINRFMNSRLGWGGPVLGGLVTGAGVTVLESVCTGQSYVPVLMYMLKRNCADLCIWMLLIIYNLLFIFPLAVVFVCFHRGMELKSLIQWSRKNLVVVKILLGAFFAAMALLLLWPK